MKNSLLRKQIGMRNVLLELEKQFCEPTEISVLAAENKIHTFFNLTMSTTMVQSIVAEVTAHAVWQSGQSKMDFLLPCNCCVLIVIGASSTTEESVHTILEDENIDARCRYCGEPMDVDEFHSMGASFEQAYADFRKYGYGAVDHYWSDKPLEPCKGRDPSGKAETAGVVMDLLGSDVDGAASLLDDL